MAWTIYVAYSYYLTANWEFGKISLILGVLEYEFLYNVLHLNTLQVKELSEYKDEFSSLEKKILIILI